MDPLEIMLTSGSNRDDDMQKALSSGLRRRREISELAQITGDDVLTPFGQNLAASVSRDTQLEKKAMEADAQRQLTSGYYKQMAEQSALKNAMALRKQEEYERHNRATEKNQLLRSNPMGSFKAPTVSAQKKTEEAKESYQSLQRVLKSYKEDYANNTFFPFEGSISNTFGKYTGTDDQQDQSRWWADYDLLYTLGRRNKLFGSALTDSEIRAWEGANISPNSPPEVIQRGLKTLTEIAERKLKEQYANDAPLYKPEWVQSVYGDITPMPQFGAPTASPSGQDGDRPAGGESGDGSFIWGELR